MTHLAILENTDLQPLNTLSAPACARWFAKVSDSGQAREALAFARQRGLPVLVLGGGSNVLLPEQYPGLVIHNAIRGLDCIEDNQNEVLVSVAGGETWHQLVMHCLDKHWHGIENLALIPGSVGAAPVQNIGAYGVELEQVFESLEAINIHTGESKTFSKKDCAFAYRQSVFKGEEKGQWMIVGVCLRLQKQLKEHTHYPALQQYFSQQGISRPDARQIVNAVIGIRQSKLPDPEQIPNAGSFFKNPLVSKDQYKALSQKFPGLVAYPAGDNKMKLAAGWLLENAGWKGKVEQGKGMHHQQALVLTNPGRKNRDELLAFAREVSDSVRQRFGVGLEIEPDTV